MGVVELAALMCGLATLGLQMFNDGVEAVRREDSRKQFKVNDGEREMTVEYCTAGMLMTAEEREIADNPYAAIGDLGKALATAQKRTQCNPRAVARAKEMMEEKR